MAGPVFPAFLKLEHQRDGTAKASFLAEVDSMLGSAERKFREFSAEASQQLDAALSVKRNNVGSLDLGVDQLRAAATAQQARAIAAREVAQATALAAKEEGDYSRQARLAVAATEALAIEEERAAAKAMAHAQAAEQVQSVLNRQKSATDAVVQATGRGTTAFGLGTSTVRANRVAMVQLGQQMQDMVIQWQMGTRAVTIFTQQLPQAAFALSNTEGRVGAVARFLSGPWGAAFVLAIAAIGPLVTQLFKAGDAADDLKKKSMSLSDALREYKTATDEARKALDEYNAAQDKARDNADYMIKVNLASAEARLKDAMATREQLKALLEKRAADLAPSNQPIFTDPTQAEGYQAGLSYELRQTLAAIGTNNSDIARLGQATRNLRIDDAKRDAAAAVDPIKAINNLYDDMAAKAENAAAGNDRLAKSLTATLTAIERQRKAALDAAKPGGTGNAQFGREIDSAQAQSIASAAGFRVTSANRSYAEQQWLYDHKRTAENPVARPGTSAHERGNALDIAFGPGVSVAAIRKAYAEEGVKLTKILKESGHFHIEWSTSGADKAQREAEAIARAQQQLQQFGERSAEAIARVNERFDEAPRLIDQAAQATRQLDSIIAELAERKPPGFEQMIADAQAAKGVIEDALVRPFRELTQDSERRIQIQTLLVQGRDAEANALQTIWQLEDRLGPLTAERKREVLAVAEAEEKANRALEVRRQQIGYYLDATRSIRSELEGLFSGRGANFGQIFKDLQSKVLVEKLFGPALRDLEDTVKRGGVKEATDQLVTETQKTSTALSDLTDAITGATSRISHAAASGVTAGGAFTTDNPAWQEFLKGFDAAFAKHTPANDNPNEIVVTAKRPGGDGATLQLNPNTVAGTSLVAYSEMVAGVMTKPLIDAIATIAPALAASLGPVLNGALGGYFAGGIPGAIFGGLKGIPGLSDGLKNLFGSGLDGAITGTIVSGIAQSLGIKNFSTTGSQIGGALGGIAGTAVGGLLGSVLGPVGSILGGLLGSLFHSAKWGYAQVSNTGITTGSNRAEEGQAASQAGDAVSQGVQRIADALGGQIGSYLVSIGVTDGHWRYSTTGRTGELKSKYSDVHLTGDGEEGYQAALRAAISDAIRDGAIVGIRVTTQKILQAGGDIEQQLQKAVDFESVFKRLKQIKDPVGAAIDELNTEFSKLKAIFVEAGASVEEYAQLEELYGLERAKAVKQAMDQISSSLQSLYDDLTLNNPTLSLTDRKAEALAKYTPLAAKVAAGDLTASDDFAAVARTLLDIQRQLYGSGAEFFALQDQVKSLTENALDAVTSVANASANSDSPFVSNAAQPSAANDNASIVSALNDMGYNVVGNLSDLGFKLDAINSNLGALIQQGLATGVITPTSVSAYPWAGNSYW